jgi:hypothetical protein
VTQQEEDHELAEVQTEYARAKASKRAAMLDHDRLLRVLRAAERSIRRERQRRSHA